MGPEFDTDINRSGGERRENESCDETEEGSEHELLRRRMLLCGKYDAIKKTVIHFAAEKDDVEDLTQDIFLIAYCRIGQLKQEDRIDSWLYKIAGRYVTRHRKARRQRELHELRWAGEKAEAACAVDSAGRDFTDTRIEYGELIALLRSLTIQERDILKMQYLLGFSLAEIAELLHMNYNTVKTVKARGLKKLRRKLKDSESLKAGGLPKESEIRRNGHRNRYTNSEIRVAKKNRNE